LSIRGASGAEEYYGFMHNVEMWVRVCGGEMFDFGCLILNFGLLEIGRDCDEKLAICVSR